MYTTLSAIALILVGGLIAFASGVFNKYSHSTTVRYRTVIVVLIGGICGGAFLVSRGMSSLLQEEMSFTTHITAFIVVFILFVVGEEFRILQEQWLVRDE